MVEISKLVTQECATKIGHQRALLAPCALQFDECVPFTNGVWRTQGTVSKVTPLGLVSTAPSLTNPAHPTSGKPEMAPHQLRQCLDTELISLPQGIARPVIFSDFCAILHGQQNSWTHPEEVPPNVHHPPSPPSRATARRVPRHIKDDT